MGKMLSVTEGKKYVYNWSDIQTPIYGTMYINMV